MHNIQFRCNSKVKFKIRDLKASHLPPRRSITLRLVERLIVPYLRGLRHYFKMSLSTIAQTV